MIILIGGTKYSGADKAALLLREKHNVECMPCDAALRALGRKGDTDTEAVIRAMAAVNADSRKNVCIYGEELTPGLCGCLSREYPDSVIALCVTVTRGYLSMQNANEEDLQTIGERNADMRKECALHNVRCFTVSRSMDAEAEKITEFICSGLNRAARM